MSAQEGDVYILRSDEGSESTESEGGWVSPRPASEVILESVVEHVDKTRDEFEELKEYVDLDDLATLFTSNEDADDTLSFDIEGHEVTVHRSGEVDVACDG